ncbi:hypothetical protein SAY87_023043 [Trapa incisa]|uniref:Auxin-responsive protein n=1 Tax=Trapa incisa TaxID=236973 RepID=A0AAN7K5B3_9MYRT|nr:hypothetical protein SAY87_023043 [Trapa incisa]
MDGAPYLRKIELGVYEGYRQLLTALEDMFKLSMGTYTYYNVQIFLQKVENHERSRRSYRIDKQSMTWGEQSYAIWVR